MSSGAQPTSDNSDKALLRHLKLFEADKALFQYEIFTLRKADRTKEGQASFQDIYSAVGTALSAWESSVNELSELFIHLVGAKDSVSAYGINRAFGAINSTSSKFEAIGAAAEVYFAHEWKRCHIHNLFGLFEKCLKQAEWRRNEIAHGIASSYGKSDGSNKGCFLGAPQYKSSTNDAFTEASTDEIIGNPLYMTRSKYLYDRADLLDYAKKFNDLKPSIQTLIRRIQPNERGQKNIVFDMFIAAGERLELELREASRRKLLREDTLRKRGTKSQPREDGV